MSGQELALIDDEDDDVGLSARQISALERLAELGAEPATPDPSKPGKMLYDSNPQIRALQLVYEGRFGGAGRGQGRPKPVQPRAAEVLAEEIRATPYVRKMKKALERGLRKDAGPRVNNDTIKLSIDIERGERALQIKEEEHEDSYNGSRNDLIAEFITLFTDPTAERAFEGYAEEQITDAIVVENKTGSADTAGVTTDSRETRDKRVAPVTKKIGNNDRVSRKNDRKGSNRTNPSRKKVNAKSIKRRPAK